MLGFLSDKQGEVRQAAAYGCGVLGQFSGPAFAQVCAQAIPRLVQVIQDADSRNEVNLNPTENAIAAVTKILKYNASAVNVDEVCYFSSCGQVKMKKYFVYFSGLVISHKSEYHEILLTW